mgnify:FL=1|tara:strand:+ start:1775 stop:2179 length:405 start_codon:yes stop_codon:yes gene_type:complete
MATLIPTLTISSSDATSDMLSFSVVDNLTIKAPSQSLSQVVVDTTGANNIIVPANDNKQTWVFVRHTGTTDGSTTTAAHCDIELTGDVAIGTLKPGEWFWFPHCGNGSSTGIQLQSVSGSIQMEYGYWSDSTAQ